MTKSKIESTAFTPEGTTIDQDLSLKFIGARQKQIAKFYKDKEGKEANKKTLLTFMHYLKQKQS
ncbi:MAG: hypothetical protein H2069_04480 [Legionella sp.]|nr:hypothetical protein [Legionella sp.]